jgi:hypothetical protein
MFVVFVGIASLKQICKHVRSEVWSLGSSATSGGHQSGMMSDQAEARGLTLTWPPRGKVQLFVRFHDDPRLIGRPRNAGRILIIQSVSSPCLRDYLDLLLSLSEQIFGPSWTNKHLATSLSLIGVISIKAVGYYRSPRPLISLHCYRPAPICCPSRLPHQMLKVVSHHHSVRATSPSNWHLPPIRQTQIKQPPLNP